MIEPVSVPILLDLELEEQELDLSIEEAEEYAAQIGSLIAVSEVYGGLPSGGNAGEILIKNSNEDYDAIWGIVKNGANIWWTNHLITQGDTAIYAAKRYVIGRTDMQPEIHDFLVGRDIEVTEGTPNTLYEIIGINQLVYNLKRIGNIGENDYNKLLNKPQIDGIEINKDSTPASLGLATASALEEKYTKPSGGIPASDLAEGVIPEVHNIPSGGSTGQALIKNSNEDYDAIWSDIDSELPDVNNTDYGKVLTVSNDGIWNAQQPIFMVTITYKNNVFSANKTFSEITNAAGHNMMVVATYAGAYYQYCGTGGGAAVRQFVYIFTRDNVQTIKLFSVNINNVWTQYQYQLGTYSKPDSGIPASDLADDIHLIPAGGSEGYVLKKNSSNDYDVIWTEDNITEIKYFDFTWDGEHNPIPATGVTGEAIFDAIANGKLVFARVTVGDLSYPYIFSLHTYYSNTLLEFVSVNGPIINVLGYSYFFGQDSWSINEYIIPDPAQDIPADLGVAAIGSSSAFARADHVHAMPSAADIGAYVKPSGGIPASDLDTVYAPEESVIGAVTELLDLIGNKYAKPSGGIPKGDLANEVQTSLGKADTALQEHQDVSGKLDKTGGTMSGILNMGSQKITNLAAGVNAQDAVNLQQVQTIVEEGAATYRGNFSNKNNLISQSWQSIDSAAPYYVDTNDFAIVTADETHNNECWRYVYSENIGWEAEYKINDSPMSQAQLDALNSGITAAKVTEFEGKYSKPNSGIPSSDLASTVQASLGKADTALQPENVDDSFSTTSESPVQNKVITDAFNSIATQLQNLQLTLDDKVNVVDGKGLSTEDYTTAEKTKLAGIATGAQVNVIESVKVNGTALPVSSKSVDVTVPTKTSELDNDEGYLTGYIVNYTLGETNSCDKSYNDIISAAATGKTGCVRILEESPSGRIDYIGQTTNVLAGPNGELIIILAVGYDSLFIITHTSNDEITSQLNSGTMSDAISSLNTVVSNLSDTVDNKVDKEDGKGLSTNDYTNDDKAKLADAVSAAEVEGLIAERVPEYIPTRVSELENDAGYLAGHIITYNDTGNGISCNEDFSYISGALSSREPIIVFGAIQNQYFANCMCSSIDSNGAILHVLTSGPSSFVVIRHDLNNIITLTAYDNAPIDSIIEGSDSPVTSGAVYQELQDYVTNTELQGTMNTVNTAIGQKADASSVYTKTEIDQKLVGAMNYKGTKATTAALPSSGNAQGDVWHVTADGSEWAWNGSTWEELGTAIDLSGYVESSDLGLATNADIDELFT